MEIKVGEYVRLKKGEIFKIDENTTNYYNSNKEYVTNEIVKHSKNIIDIIECGDYINGKEVKHIAWFEGVPDYPKLIFADEHRLIPGETAENDEIKSVVTKEQFNQMKYIVGE